MIGPGLFRRQFGAGDLIGLCEFAFQSQHESEILPDAAVRARAERRVPKHRFGALQVVGKEIGEAEIVQDRFISSGAIFMPSHRYCGFPRNCWC